MSYGINLVRLPIDATPEDVAEASIAMDEEAERDPGEPNPSSEQWKHQLVRSLQEINPSLEAFPFDYAELARSKHITEHEARRLFRHVELNDPEPTTGIQIMLFDNSAALTVAFWHHGAVAVRVWREIWSYLMVLQDEGGLRAFDPQLEQVLSLETDFDAVVRKYEHGVRVTDEVAARMTGSPPTHKPWWRFW